MLAIINKIIRKINGREDGLEYFSMANHYTIMQISLALEKVGFFRELECSPRSIKELAQILGAKENLLGAAVEFLLNTTNLLRKNGELVSFNNKRAARGIFQWAIWKSLAYKPIFDYAAELMRGEMTYGKDTVRDGYYCAKYSEALTGKKVIEHALRWAHQNADTLVDFGCGSACSLIKFCAFNKKGRAIGIDCDPDVVELAKRNTLDAGLSDRVRIINADILDIKRWKAHVSGDRILFLASGVIHELLRSGEKFTINFFRDLKDFFPKASFILIEVDTTSFDKLPNVDLKYTMLAVMLIHSFSAQGMPQPKERWEKILNLAGWHIKKIEPFSYTRIIFYCSATNQDSIWLS